MWRGGERGRGRRRGGWRRGEGAEHISLGDPPARPGAGDAGDVEVLLGHQPTDRRRERSITGALIALRHGRRAAGSRLSAVRAVGGRLARRGTGTGPGRRRTRRGRLDRAHGRADGDCLPLGYADLQDPRARRRHDVRRLVGLELEQRLTGLHRRSLGLEPARDDALGDRFAHAGHGDRDGGHGITSGQWSVVSGQWSVVSKAVPSRRWPGVQRPCPRKAHATGIGRICLH